MDQTYLLLCLLCAPFVLEAFSLLRRNSSQH